MDKLGERLRDYRAALGLTQAGIARTARISKAYLSELESGVGRRPSADVMLRLADALSVTIADLLGRSVEAEEQTEVPSGLRELAADLKLTDAEVRMLASIRLREGTPRTRERWEFIYNAIKGSGHLDRKR